MMNRPKIDDYIEFEQLTEKGAYNFITDLIRYCDELEKNKDKQFNAGFNEATKICSEKIIALEEALDRACEKLVEMKDACNCWEFESCPFREKCSEGTNYCGNKDKWKEWAFKDE